MRMRPVVVAAVLFAASFAAADDPCPNCASAFENQPDIHAWLSANGFPATGYTAAVAWTESTPDGQSVYGYRLVPRAGGEPFDLYADENGALLDAEALAARGVAPKQWNAVHIETDPEAAVGQTPPSVPAPRWPASKSIAQTIMLPSLDAQQLIEEDNKSGTGEKGVLRTGVFQSLPKPLRIDDTKSAAGWQTLPDGARIWSATIVSPGAVGQRIEFARLTLPAGGYAIAYNTGDPNERYGPFTAIPAADEVLWSPTCFSESVTLEVVLPGPGAADVVVNRIAHIYRGLDELPWGGPKAAGACNLDLACYDDWLTVANGVGGLVSIDKVGTIFCTGTLIVDTDPSTQIPYVLTANHCVGNPIKASSTEVYWFYQRPSCGGAAPDLATVPRTTGGADLLATSFANRPNWTGTDFSLLRLHNAPPAGATFVGWTTVPPELGVQTTCIHHPNKDFKRITFGEYTNNADSCFVGAVAPASKYFQSTWTDGTTEPGSSGSPLLHHDTQRIIGQLWGGYASCSSLTCPDYYGRFDVSFPMMAQYLNPGAAGRTVQFAPTSYTVDEDHGHVTLTIVLNVPPAGSPATTVTYTTAPNTATENNDFTYTTGTVVFEEFQTSATFEIPILEDGVIEPDESFTVTLSSPVSSALGANTTATITIRDNDVDTDRDGLSDYDELNATYGYVTDPNNPDSDGDHVSDGYEIIFGSDPANADDIPSIPSLPVPWFK